MPLQISFYVKQLATDADESVVRKAAFSLPWLDVFLVLENFCLLLLSRESPWALSWPDDEFAE